MFCPSVMTPADKDNKLDLSLRPRGNNLNVGKDVPGKWFYPGLSRIPLVGHLMGFMINATTNLNTTLEDCADWIAADLEQGLDSEFVGHRAGPYDLSDEGKVKSG